MRDGQKMSEGKFTPGPWDAVYVPEIRSILIGTEDRQTAFARMQQFDGTPDDETQRANARLIVAAPDMYEALARAEAELPPGPTRDAVRTALAKAEAKSGS